MIIKATTAPHINFCKSKCIDRKSTRLNSSHLGISYAVFCLKKKKRAQHVSARLQGKNRTVHPLVARNAADAQHRAPTSTCARARLAIRQEYITCGQHLSAAT